MKNYDVCPYYKIKYTEEDIFGHDSYDEFCTKNGEQKKVIGCIHCKKCKEIIVNQTELLVGVAKNVITTYSEIPNI